MTGGNVINQPRSALQKNLRRAGRIRRAQNKKQKKTRGFKRPRDSLTTSHILRKTRTNPKANITLSGKKKRLLLKQIQKQQKEEASMEVAPMNTETKSNKPAQQKQKMDTD